MSALNRVAMYLVQHIPHRSLDDTVYWGAALPSVLNAVWYAGVVACFVVLLLVTPAVLVFRALRTWAVLLGPKTRDTLDQRRALEQRGPRF